MCEHTAGECQFAELIDAFGSTFAQISIDAHLEPIEQPEGAPNPRALTLNATVTSLAGLRECARVRNILKANS